mmetsp:Transcript_23257/g.26952  ORF Transcript_23257/g.26952 Transcript_23257/m.26952 type:complete len:115 (+) Transcript_23257:54-398(+)
MDNQEIRVGINDQSPNPKANTKHSRTKSIESNGVQQPSINSVPKRSILKKSGAGNKEDPDRLRLDSNGNTIKTGGKKHKLVFREKLCEVMEVESWKAYNAEEDHPNGKSCCNII